MQLAPALAPLRHREFRHFWCAQIVSMSGSMMQTAALLWHVALLVEPDRRALALGAVGLVKVAPIVLCSLLGGVVADAIDRRRLMIATQSAMAVFAAVLAWQTQAGRMSLPLLYTLAALSSAANAFDAPARSALVPALVPREDLPGAISLTTILFHASSTIGPAVGGIVIASLGLAWAYALNALSFLGVIAALASMRRVRAVADEQRARISWSAAVDGLRFVWRHQVIRASMLLDFWATFFSSATALLPIYAQDLLGVGARGFGWLSAAPAVGALLTSVALVPVAPRLRRRGPILLWAVVIYGLATIGFGVATSFALAFACLALTGAADTVSMVVRNLIRQLSTPDALRGRMTSVNMIFFMGGPQLGELEAGLVAHAAGPVFSVVSGGIGCLIATAWIAARAPLLRRASIDDP